MSGELSFSVEMPGGTQIAASLLGFGDRLAASMREAMTDIEISVSNTAADNMHWANPSGALEESIITDSSVLDDFTAEIGSSLPYSRRRELGFSGMTDSLGRFYANDPGAFFLTDSLDITTPYIEQRVSQAVSDTWNIFGA